MYNEHWTVRHILKKKISRQRKSQNESKELNNVYHADLQKFNLFKFYNHQLPSDFSNMTRFMH